MTPLARSLDWYTRARRSESRIERFVGLWIAVESALRYTTAIHYLSGAVGEYCTEQRRQIGAVVASMTDLTDFERETLTCRLRRAWLARCALMHEGSDGQITQELIDALEADAYRVVDHAFTLDA